MKMRIVRVSLLLLLGLIFASPASAQVTVPVKFNTREKGEDKKIGHWGVDATWLNFYNAKFSKKNAGDDIDFVRVGFYLHEKTNQDGSLSAGQIKMLDDSLKYVHMIDAKLPLKLSPNNMKGVIDWYKNPDGSANLGRWYNVMEKTKEYLEAKGHKIIAIEVFNEPDFKRWNMGNRADLNKLSQMCKDWDVLRVGPCTLSTTPLVPWYKAIEANIDAGATHTLGGKMKEYTDFIKGVKRRKKQFINPEVHSLVEVIVGAEEGMDAACWWDQINVGRAAFMRASEGKRIAYVPVEQNWSAACVYRAPDGVLYGFASSNERTNGKETIFNFVCSNVDATYYLYGKSDKAVFRKKGKPFAVQAKDESIGKKSITHWFTIVPAK